MGDGVEAAEDWPAYLRRMTSRPGWSVARLARESGIHRGTIFDWIAGKGGFTVASVKAIAAALGDEPGNALLAAGAVANPAPDHLDPDVRVIVARLADPNISEGERNSIRATLQYLREMAERSAGGEPEDTHNLTRPAERTTDEIDPHRRREAS